MTFSVWRCPPTVKHHRRGRGTGGVQVGLDHAAALTWEALLDSLDMETRAKVLDEMKRPDSTVRKALVKAAIEAEAPADWKERLKQDGAFPVSVESVPGAAIVAGEFSLARK